MKVESYACDFCKQSPDNRLNIKGVEVKELTKFEIVAVEKAVHHFCNRCLLALKDALNKTW